MKNSQFYFNQKGQKVEIWHEEVNGNIDYWKKENGISTSLSREAYEKELKKIKGYQSQFL